VHYARDGGIDFWGGNFAAIEACDGRLLLGGRKKKKCGNSYEEDGVSHGSLANGYYGISPSPVKITERRVDWHQTQNEKPSRLGAGGFAIYDDRG